MLCKTSLIHKKFEFYDYIFKLYFQGPEESEPVLRFLTLVEVSEGWVLGVVFPVLNQGVREYIYLLINVYGCL